MTPRVPTRIETERLVLRVPEARDMQAYVAYYTGDRTGGVGGPVESYIAAERFMAMIGQWQVHGYGRYAICEGDGVGFGHCGILDLGEGFEPELTWTLWSKDREGQGFATEAARAAADAYFASVQPAVPAFVDETNAPSRRVADRLGAREVGPGPRGNTLRYELAAA